MAKVKFECAAPTWRFEMGWGDGTLVTVPGTDGEPFETDDPRLIAALDEQPAVVRVEAATRAKRSES